MNQADKDAQKWAQDNAKWQERELYRAKETGDAYFINEFGVVITEKPKAKEKSE